MRRAATHSALLARSGLAGVGDGSAVANTWLRAPGAAPCDACATSSSTTSSSSSSSHASSGLHTSAAALHASQPATAGKKAAAAAAPPSAGGGKAPAAAEAGAGAGEGQQWSQLAHARGSYQRSRMLEFYERHLARELMLKLDVRSVNELPRLERVHLSVQARRALGTPLAEKWQLLLHALALEVATGAPADFALPGDRYYRRRNAVTGVSVRLSGAAAHDALEKVVHLLLPAQSAFAGVLTRQLDLDGHLHFRAANAAGLPDFEEMFETFEGVGGLDVGVVTRNAPLKRAGRARLLLTGMQVPLMAQRYRVGAAGGGGEGAAEGGGGGGGGDAPSAAGSGSGSSSGSDA